MNIEIRPTTQTDIEAAETLILQAFSNTFRPVFGNRSLETQVQVHVALRRTRSQPTDGIMVAMENDTLVGVNLWKTAEMGTRYRAGLLRALSPLGPLGILRFLLVNLTVYWRYKPAPKEAYLCGLAVTPTHRHQGIGLALMQRVEKVAQEGGKSFISGFAASQNLAFRALVQKLGYREVWIRKTPIRNWVLGEQKVVRIEKILLQRSSAKVTL